MGKLTEEFKEAAHSRVKCLDREDIESFGFENYIDRYKLVGSGGMEYMLFHHSDKKTISIIELNIEKDLVGNKYNNLRVKNKSELKKVLEQIGIL